MGSFSLALRDIWRQKPRSILFISIQSMITAAGMVFCSLAVDFQEQMKGTENIQFNQVIIQSFDGFLTFMVSFSIIAGILTASILTALITISRMEDLATLLSLGGTLKKIQRVPLAQIFLITLISGIIGWCGSIIGILAISLCLELESLRSNFVVNVLFPSVYIALQLIGTYFVSGFIVNYLLRKKFREIINGQFSIVPVNHNRIWRISTRGKTSFLLAYLITKRSKVLSIIVVVCLSVLIFLPTFGALGGDIIRNTTISYIKRGYGSNNYVITTPDLSPVVKELYNPYRNSKFNFPFIDENNSLPPSFITSLGNYSAFEARILLTGKAKAITSLKVRNGNIVSPGNRTIETFFWGINGKSTLFDYHHSGQMSLIDSKTIHIGDGIQQTFLYGQVIESIVIEDVNNGLKKFKIESVVVDPFALGNCIYININEVAELKNIDFDYRNVIFVNNPSGQVFDLVNQFCLSIFPLDTLKQKYIMKSDSFWIVTTIMSSPALFSAGLSLVAYTGLVVRVILQKDLKILRILGGKHQTILRVILWVNLLGLRATPLAVLLGYIFAYYSLIEDPIIPSIEIWCFLIFEFFIISFLIYLYVKKLSTSISTSNNCC